MIKEIEATIVLLMFTFELTWIQYLFCVSKNALFLLDLVLHASVFKSLLHSCL